LTTSPTNAAAQGGTGVRGLARLARGFTTLLRGTSRSL